MILDRVGAQRDSFREAQTSWSVLSDTLPLMEEAKFHSADLSARCKRLAGANFFVVVVLFLLSQYPRYVISLRLTEFQYPDCAFLWIYMAQHYRTLQTNSIILLLIQKFLWVPPSALKCPQKNCKT